MPKVKADKAGFLSEGGKVKSAKTPKKGKAPAKKAGSKKK